MSLDCLGSIVLFGLLPDTVFTLLLLAVRESIVLLENSLEAVHTGLQGLELRTQVSKPMIAMSGR